MKDEQFTWDSGKSTNRSNDCNGCGCDSFDDDDDNLFDVDVFGLACCCCCCCWLINIGFWSDIIGWFGW